MGTFLKVNTEGQMKLEKCFIVISEVIYYGFYAVKAIFHPVCGDFDNTDLHHTVHTEDASLLDFLCIPSGFCLCFFLFEFKCQICKML